MSPPLHIGKIYGYPKTVFVEPYNIRYTVTVSMLILTWLPPKHNMVSSSIHGEKVIELKYV